MSHQDIGPELEHFIMPQYEWDHNHDRLIDEFEPEDSIHSENESGTLTDTSIPDVHTPPRQSTPVPDIDLAPVTKRKADEVMSPRRESGKRRQVDTDLKEAPSNESLAVNSKRKAEGLAAEGLLSPRQPDKKKQNMDKEETPKNNELAEEGRKLRSRKNIGTPYFMGAKRKREKEGDNEGKRGNK